MDYSLFTDDEIVSFSKQNNDEALLFLINKYKPLVKIRARMYFLAGCDSDDVMQEGMIGLYNAILKYDDKSSASFKTFAEICINNQIKTAVRNANRLKHSMLNNSLSISLFDIEFEKNSKDSSKSPLDILLDKESLSNLIENINTTLSPLEQNVLQLFLLGKSNFEIAKILSKSEKSVNNSLFRLRKKIGGLI